LKQTFSGTELIARIGGDGFAVVYENTSPDEINKKVEELNVNIMKKNSQGNRTYSLSASVGVAISRPDEDEAIDDLINRADEVKYKQKRARRKNRKR